MKDSRLQARFGHSGRSFAGLELSIGAISTLKALMCRGTRRKISRAQDYSGAPRFVGCLRRLWIGESVQVSSLRTRASEA